MPVLKFSNFARSTLASSIVAADTSLSVQPADASKFPVLGAGDYFHAVLVDSSANREILKVTARAGAVLTVERAQQGTTARDFGAGTTIALRLTAADYLAMQTLVDAPGGATALKTNLGLELVDNTPDAEKPISAPQQEALDLKAPLESPEFTGNPTAPTPSPGDNDTSIATTGFVKAAIDVVLGGVSSAFDTLAEIAAAIGAINTNALFRNIEDQEITGGGRVTPKDLGNLSGQTITPDPGDRPIFKITNNGAGSILPGSNPGSYLLQVVNATGAGAITTTGWTLTGDDFDTTSTSKFLCSCLVTDDMKVMTIQKVA